MLEGAIVPEDQLARSAGLSSAELECTEVAQRAQRRDTQRS